MADTNQQPKSSEELPPRESMGKRAMGLHAITCMIQGRMDSVDLMYGSNEEDTNSIAITRLLWLDTIANMEPGILEPEPNFDVLLAEGQMYGEDHAWFVVRSTDDPLVMVIVDPCVSTEVYPSQWIIPPTTRLQRLYVAEKFYGPGESGE